MRSDEEIVAKALLEQALVHSRKKRFEEAAHILRSAVKVLPEKATLWGMLGSMEFRLENYGASAKAFRETVKRSPTSELASLGLFHSLLSLGRERAAIKELKRYQSVAHSDDYEEIAAKNHIRIPVAA